MSDFATLLRKHREAKRWSQEYLALECNMDHSLVSRIERDQRNATRESIGKLVAGLGLAPAQADELYLAAGLVPPDLSPALVRQALALLRAATTTIDQRPRAA